MRSSCFTNRTSVSIVPTTAKLLYSHIPIELHWHNSHAPFSLRGPQWVNQTRDKRSSNLLFAPSLKSTTNVDLPVSHSNPRKTGRHQASSETRSRVETSLSSIPCLQGVVRQSVRLCRIRRTRYVRYQPVHSARSMDMSRSCSM